MGFALAKALVLVQLSLFFFTVFGDEEIEAVSPIPPHHPYPATPPSHPPTQHHHHHHSHPPALAPSHHHHHHHHAHPPSHAPVYSQAHAPAHPPMPHSHPPTHSPKPQPHPHPNPNPHPPVKPPSKPPTYPFERSFVSVQGVVYCKSCKYPGVDTLLGASPLSGATVKLQCNNTKYHAVEAKATTDKNGYFFLEAPKNITNYGVHKCKVSLFSAPNTACSKPTDLHGGVSGGLLRPEKKYISNKLPFVLFSVGPFAFEPKCPR